MRARMQDRFRPCRLHDGAGARCGLLDPCWIELVAKTSDNDLRAHRIAMSYRHWGLELDRLIHGDNSMEAWAGGSNRPECNANWFNFAVWGTLTATQNISNERAPQRLNNGVVAPLRRRLTPAILRAKAADGQLVGRALAWAQRVVFVTTGCGLMHLAERLQSDRATELDHRTFSGSTEGALLRRLANFPEPPEGTIGLDHHETWWFKEDRHVPPLISAFELYRRANTTSDVATRSKIVFGANVALTAVEQDVLDPALSFVVGLVPRRIGESVDWRLATLQERWRGLPRHFTFGALQLMPRAERRLADLTWSRFMTDQVLVMALPTETLRVGRDIPPWRRGRPYLPRHLAGIEPPADDKSEDAKVLRQIHRHVESLDRTVGEGRGSAARDWRRWDERLNWAITLLRTRQHDESLFWHPYSMSDERRIAFGELPARWGDPSAMEVQPPLDANLLPLANLTSENL